MALLPAAALGGALALLIKGVQAQERRGYSQRIPIPPPKDIFVGPINKPQLPQLPDVPNMPTTTPSRSAAGKAPRGVNTTGRRAMRLPKKAVSIVTRAPVAIGNTVRGTTTVDRMTRNGQACMGRDFMFTPIAPGAVANWTMVGGCPLSPTAFADSTLRQYAQIYNKFRFLSFTAHFITSSPTSTNGDVMFYYAKNRESPFINQTSVNLLPFVMSDPNAVLGPQWQNMSATFDVDSEWKSLDYGIDDSPKEYAAGELFLLCKTSNTESPGYVIFDYTIEFGEKSIQPRLLSLPITREIYNQVATAIWTGNSVINTPYQLQLAMTPNISGTTSAWPVGIADGDIFKIIIDRTNSTLGLNFANITNSLYGHEIPGSSGTIVYSDGMICYGVYNSNNSVLTLYLNSTSAYSGAANRQFWASGTGIVSASTFQIWMSYVGSTSYLLSNISNF